MTRSVVPPSAPGSARSRRSRETLTVAATAALAGALLTAPASDAVAETVVSQSSAEGIALAGGAADSATVDVTGASGSIRSVEIRVSDLAHSNPGDLEMSLTSPAGTQIGLLGSCSGSFEVTELDLRFAAKGTPLTEYAFLHTAIQPIAPTACTGTLPTDLTALVDEDPNGTWTLTAQSAAATGSIESWTLDLVTGEAPRIAYTTGLDNPLVVDASASLLYHRPTLTAPFTVTAPPSHGSLSLDVSAGGFTYAPDAGYSGPDVFSGTDSDGTPFTVDLTVAPSGVEGGTTRIAASTTPFELGVGGSIGSSPTSTAIDVDGGAQVVAEAEITLVGFEHELLRHVMAAVETPDGTASTLTDNCGDDYSISGDITFADGGVPLPDGLTGTPGELTSGTYAPQRCIFPTSAQPGIGEITDVGFEPLMATPADGDWEFYLYDDGPGAEGTVAGWLLRLVTLDEGDVAPATDPAPHVFRTRPQTPLYVDGSSTSVAIDAPVEEIASIDDEATAGEVTFDDATGSFAYSPAEDFAGVDTFDIHTTDTMTTVVVVVDGVPGPNLRTYVADDGRGLSIPSSGSVEQSLTMTDPDNPHAPDLAPASIVDVSATLVGFEHSYPTDLIVTLQNGSRSVQLLRHCGRGGFEVEDRVIEFADGAPAAPSDVELGSGRFAPTVCLGESEEPGTAATFGEAFAGQNLVADGPWTLRVDDLWDYDDGAVSSWRVSVTTQIDLTVEDGRFMTPEDTELTMPLPGGLALLTSGTAAPEATYAVVSGPKQGTLDLEPDGSFIYTPEPDFWGTASFTATASAAGHTTAPATVTLDVLPVNDPPAATDAAFEVVAGEALEEDLTGHASDVDGDPLAFTVATPPEHGALELSEDGSFTYRSDEGFAGTDEFVFAVSDGVPAPSPSGSAAQAAEIEAVGAQARVIIEVLPAEAPSPSDPSPSDPADPDPTDSHPTGTGDHPDAPGTSTTGEVDLPSTGSPAFPMAALTALLLAAGASVLLVRRRSVLGSDVPD
ncbi:tandem-95 repeat protein [Ruania alkalisoli]|uniref:Tandem-95 repeat protein n=1 Tax=Ruania alkalisoli TaxID=2779775 RepID=A0A7M1SVH2_9MICO|nr:Ig-like domain-containing protein [Ruania alkalisoli]QOR71580.1 tandem-95 repeat protein [Ruania alkalisoli]